jgi:hypothetical protein
MALAVLAVGELAAPARDTLLHREGIGLEDRRLLVEEGIGEGGHDLPADQVSAILELQVDQALGALADGGEHPALLLVDAAGDVLQGRVLRHAEDGRPAAGEDDAGVVLCIDRADRAGVRERPHASAHMKSLS